MQCLQRFYFIVPRFIMTLGVFLYSCYFLIVILRVLVIWNDTFVTFLKFWKLFYDFHVQRTLVITKVFVTKDFAVKPNLLL